MCAPDQEMAHHFRQVEERAEGLILISKTRCFVKIEA